MSRTRSDLLNEARSDIGEPGRLNTCMIAVARWLRGAGFPLNGDHSDGNGRADQNVSDFHDLARRGLDGYAIIPIADAQPGDLLIWPDDDHITVLADVLAGDRLRSIGSGGPSNKVAYQPTGGGGNPRSYFAAAVRPPVDQPREGLPKTTTEDDGDPGDRFWARVDEAMNREPFLGAGPNGEPGRNRDAAVCRIVARDINSKGYKFPGTDDPITTTADQDGEPGSRLWTGVQVHSDTHYGTDLNIDGDPGPWTYKAYYRIAAFHLNRMF